YLLQNKNNGVYTYYLVGYSGAMAEFCSGANGNSNTITVTVDTTAPTVVSKSPIGAEKATSGSIVITFSETMNKAQTAAAASGLTLGPAVWSNSDKTVTYAYSGALSGTSYAVSVAGKDLATNPVSDSFSFTTVSAPKTVSIVNPLAGASYTQGDSIPITVNVKDNSNLAVAGATVSASGCSSAVVFSDKLNGTYTGTCTVSTFGSITISVTAAKYGESATGQVAVTVAKQAGLIMAVTAPTVFSYDRGDTVNFVISLEDDNGAAVAGASVTSTPSLSWTDNADGTYSAAMQTSAETVASVSLAITATAVVSGQTKTASQTVALSFGAITIPLTVQILSDGEEAAVAPAGSVITVKAVPELAGIALETITGTLVISDIAGNTQTKTLIFEQSGDGYIADPDYTVASGVSSLEATVSVTDNASNTGTETASMSGPVQGLSFEISSPDEWTYSAGQSFMIIGKVKSGSTGQYVSDAAVSIGGEEFEKNGNIYSYNYTVSESASGAVDIDIRIEQGGTVSVQPQNLDVSNSLSAEINDGEITGNVLFVLITYPDGTIVENGNFTAVIGDEEYPLEYANGLWMAEVDLGKGGAVYSIDITGYDSEGNALGVYSEEISYVPMLNFFEKFGQIIAILGVIMFSAVAVAVVAKKKMDKKSEEKSIAKGAKDAVERYIELGVEKELIPLKRKMITDRAIYRDRLGVLLSQNQVSAEVSRRTSEYDRKELDLSEDMARIEKETGITEEDKKVLQKEIWKLAKQREKLAMGEIAENNAIQNGTVIVKKMIQDRKTRKEIEQFLLEKVDKKIVDLIMERAEETELLK
ncbi:MAG: hypothetical protein V1911_01830, partial [Candidatus Micrarchaeota archaeon]